MSALDDAWQAALAAEHRAVFGYALLGPKLSGDDRQLAVTCSNAHESVRDRTEAALATAGLTPVGPDADYPSLYPVADAAAARRVAVTVEDAAAAAWRFLYSVATADRTRRGVELRSAGQAGLTACAVRAAQWRFRIDPSRATTPFPGL